MNNTIVVAGIVSIICALFRNYKISPLSTMLIYFVSILISFIVNISFNNKRRKILEHNAQILMLTKSQWRETISNLDRSLDNSLTVLIGFGILSVSGIVFSLFKNNLLLSLSCGLVVFIFILSLLNSNYKYIRALKRYAENLDE